MIMYIRDHGAPSLRFLHVEGISELILVSDTTMEKYGGLGQRSDASLGWVQPIQPKIVTTR